MVNIVFASEVFANLRNSIVINWFIDIFKHFGFIISRSVFFFPHRIELKRRLHCAIFNFIDIGGNQYLREQEKLWRLCKFLIANHLINRFINRNRSFLALYRGKRNTINKQNNIGTAVLVFFNLKFGNDVINIVFRFLPVNKLELRRSLFAIDNFRNGNASKQVGINIFRGFHHAIVKLCLCKSIQSLINTFVRDNIFIDISQCFFSNIMQNILTFAFAMIIHLISWDIIISKID